MHHPSLNLAAPHHDAEELLPWYATGQLDRDDAARVEQHLSSCAHCRRQLAFERRMVDEVPRLSPEVDSGWARIRRRLERRRGVSDRFRDWTATAWRSLSRPAIATLAAAQLAFVIIAGTVLLSFGKPAYRALGSAPPPPSANVIAMFRPDTTEAQLRDLLEANGASLVDGPTATDAYLLRVPGSSRPEVLARLRNDGHILMAEPIDGPRS
jgi:anti-sigma factor RsiW